MFKTNPNADIEVLVSLLNLYSAAETEKAIENANLKKSEVEKNMNSKNGSSDYNLNES